MTRTITTYRKSGRLLILRVIVRFFASVAPTSRLVSDELALRSERLLERRTKQAQFRDSQKTLDNFDFAFNKKKMNRGLVFDLATGAFIARHTKTPCFSAHPLLIHTAHLANLQKTKCPVPARMEFAGCAYRS